MLAPLELVDPLAALIPPPNRRRHHHFGLLAPNAPLRSAGTALAGVGGETAKTQKLSKQAICSWRKRFGGLLPGGLEAEYAEQVAPPKQLPKL